MSHDVIVLEHVSRFFHMDVNHTSSLKEYVVNILSGKHEIKKFQALQDVSLHVQKGEIFGIIGRNGAGKSTLLKVISGILKPSQGTCHVLGNIVPMLELGSGFDMELSGRDNVFLNGAILGYSKKFLEEQYKAIIDFSELAEFIEMPLKTYSSGMLARLAFSIATVVKPDILIVDEILAVGDMEFQKKSYARMMELMNGGTTVLLVAHDLEKIKSMCSRTLWLSHGTVRMAGETHAVCNAYAASEE